MCEVIVNGITYIPETINGMECLVPKPVGWRQGNYVKCDGNYYIVSRVNVDEFNLINILTGNRFSESQVTIEALQNSCRNRKPLLISLEDLKLFLKDRK